MNPSFVAYVDESGDEGFKFDSGSSNWFVLAAIVVRKPDDLNTVKLVDKVRVRLERQPRSPLHFRDLKHEQRLVYNDEIARASLCAIALLVHKPSLREQKVFRQGFRLYFYGVRFLLERISWYCRDNHSIQDAGDGSVEIVFSNRSGMRYDELREYLDYLRRKNIELDVRIDWNVVRPEQVRSVSPMKVMGVLIADAVASSFYYAVERSKYGFTEDRYVRMLKPVVYSRNVRCRGYGIKFYSREVDALVDEDETLKWFKEIYPQ